MLFNKKAHMQWVVFFSNKGTFSSVVPFARDLCYHCFEFTVIQIMYCLCFESSK